MPENDEKDKKEYKRLLVKITHDTLPQIKDRYPFIYLERGRLEIDDSSIKWIDSDAHIIRLPVATILTLLLGPGTSVTHEAIKVLAAANCTVCWVGEDSMLFYAQGKSPTANTRNMRIQMQLACDSEKSLEVARRMYARRFPAADLAGKKLKEMMGMEGYRVRQLYEQKAEEYQVGWKGRVYIPGKMEMSDITNQILTSCNSALYGVLTSCVFALGYSPHIGFIHSGCPLPFIYDLADLYKEYVCIDTAFKMTFDLAGTYNKYRVANEFRRRIIETALLESIGKDIESVLGVTRGRSNCE